MQSPRLATKAGNEVIDNTAHQQQNVHSSMLSVAQEKFKLLLLRFALC